MEPCSGAVGGESAAAAFCVGGRPTGLGFRPVLATAASEAALAKACAALFVPDFCLFPALCRGMVLEIQGTHNFRRRTPIDTP